MALRVQTELERNRIIRRLGTEQPPKPDEVGRMWQAMRLSADERIWFELRPNLDCTIDMAGVPTRLVTNSIGLRGSEIPVEKAKGVIRIVGIGDSFMFGYGISQQDTYLSLLERSLAQRYPQKKWEVINTAVGGYNTTQEVQTLRTKGLQFGPDLVIQGVVSNDFGRILYMPESSGALRIDRCFLTEFLLDRWYREDNGEAERFVSSDPPQENARASRSDGVLRPTLKRRSPDAFKAAMNELALMQREHGFHVVSFVTANSPEATVMRAIMEPLGFRLESFQSSVETYLKSREYANYPNSDLALTRENAHPSATHNRLIAIELLRVLEESGLIEALLAL